GKPIGDLPVDAGMDLPHPSHANDADSDIFGHLSPRAAASICVSTAQASPAVIRHYGENAAARHFNGDHSDFLILLYLWNAIYHPPPMSAKPCPPNLSLSRVRRICIIKPSALGDVVQTLPILPGLKQRFPGAAIHWVINRQFAALLEDQPFI